MEQLLVRTMRDHAHWNANLVPGSLCTTPRCWSPDFTRQPRVTGF